MMVRINDSLNGATRQIAGGIGGLNCQRCDPGVLLSMLEARRLVHVDQLHYTVEMLSKLMSFRCQFLMRLLQAYMFPTQQIPFCDEPLKLKVASGPSRLPWWKL